MNKFQGIPTTCISDVTDGLYNMDSSIQGIKENFRIEGRALPVKMPVGDNVAVLKAIQSAKQGDIIVVDAKGDTYRAAVGDLFVGLAKTLGVQAIVIDGAIRDITGVKELDFPVFCKANTIAASGKAGLGEINVPISCGGVAVCPGDLIIGDENGVLVVPKSDENRILELSKKQKEDDDEKDARITGNVEESKTFLKNILEKYN